jgi:hypothetical protein
MSPKFIAILSAAVVLAGWLGVAPQAKAASQYLCSPGSAVGVAGPRQVVNTSSTTSPQPSYSLNGFGCAVIQQADVGFFQSQGFVPGPMFTSLLFTTGVLVGNTGAGIVQMPSLPAGMMIREFIVDNSTANAVTGGIDIGTTSGGADVVSALTCAANCLTFVADAALLKRVFSKTAAQALYVLGHTAGNSANLNITMTYAPF